jgi:hypothetical protein
MITEVGTAFRTARERSPSITTQLPDFQVTSALRRLRGDRGVGAVASVDLIAVVLAVSVAAEEVGVAVTSADFVVVGASVVFVGGGRSE